MKNIDIENIDIYKNIKCFKTNSIILKVNLLIKYYNIIKKKNKKKNKNKKNKNKNKNKK